MGWKGGIQKDQEKRERGVHDGREGTEREGTEGGSEQTAGHSILVFILSTVSILAL